MTLGMPEGTTVLRDVLSRRVVSAFSQRLFVMMPFVLMTLREQEERDMADDSHQ